MQPRNQKKQAKWSGLMLGALAGLGLWGGLLLPAEHGAAQGITVTTERASAVHAGEFVVPLNKSQILRVDQRFTEILVGNPEIADVLALTDQTLYVLGRAIGSTNLTIYGPNKQLVAVLDLVVSYDIEGLKAKLYEVMPQEDLEVRTVNGSVLIGGLISSNQKLSEAMAIAERFAPENVTSAVSVQGSQQVLLQVRFAEMRRSTARELGITNINAGLVTGSTIDVSEGSVSGPGIAGVLTGIINTASFFSGGIGWFGSGFLLDVAFQALEEKGVVKTLAEPNLVALSGDTASFLAGGEFPFPVAQDDDTITIEFKQFGVGLSFTPTVTSDQVVNLEVSSEVSQLDRQNAVTISGTTIPGLATRRATTTIELRDGQAFGIAGLLQNDYQNSVSQLPWIGDIPILGALFSSTSFQRSETELVIIVTPHLVAPAQSAAQLATPVDNFVPPSDVDLFLMRRLEGAGSGMPQSSDSEHLIDTQTGGIAGQSGHIIQ